MMMMMMNIIVVVVVDISYSSTKFYLKVLISMYYILTDPLPPCYCRSKTKWRHCLKVVHWCGSCTPGVRLKMKWPSKSTKRLLMISAHFQTTIITNSILNSEFLTSILLSSYRPSSAPFISCHFAFESLVKTLCWFASMIDPHLLKSLNFVLVLSSRAFF